MELAASQGFDVRVVTLPAGQDPADAPQGFEERLGGAESYVLYRTRLELERTSDRQEAFVRAREGRRPARTTRPSARKPCACSPTGSTSRVRRSPAWRRRARPPGPRVGAPSDAPRLLAAGDRLERDALAACIAYPELARSCSPSSSPDHLDSELHRRPLRASLVDGTEQDEELVVLPRRARCPGGA